MDNGFALLQCNLLCSALPFSALLLLCFALLCFTLLTFALIMAWSGVGPH